MLADASEDIGNIGLRVEAIEFCGFDQRIEGSGAPAAGIGAGEEVILAADRNHAVILPMSGKRSRLTTAGTLCTEAVFDVNSSSGAPAVKSFTSRWHPVSFVWWRRGFWIPPPAPESNWQQYASRYRRWLN